MRAVSQQKSEQCFLEGWDPEKETWVEVREARMAEEQVRERLLSRFVVEADEGVNDLSMLTRAEMVLIECYVTFVRANIQFMVPKDGGDEIAAPFLIPEGSAMTERQFRQWFWLLPGEIAEEWHEHVRRLNPQWTE